MNRKIIQRDIAGNKAVSFLTVLFITAAAMLLSLAGILVTNLFGSIDRLMTDAKTPHFMQMHTGDVDFEELEAFAAAVINNTVRKDTALFPADAYRRCGF